MTEIERIVTRAFLEEWGRGLRRGDLASAVCHRVGLPLERVAALVVEVPCEAIYGEDQMDGEQHTHEETTRDEHTNSDGSRVEQETTEKTEAETKDEDE